MQNTRRIVKRPAHAIESVENALRLLVLLQESGPMRIVDAARELGVAPSTAHRLMATLMYRGFALQDGQHRYLAGPNLRLDASNNPHRALLATLRQPLAELAAATGETVNLVELVGGTAVFLHSVEGPQLLRIGDRTGSVLPAEVSAGGLAALSTLPDAAVAELFRGRPGGRGQPGPGSPGLTQVLAELARIRATGHAVNLGRTEPELAAVGVPLAVPGLPRTLALSLSAPASRAEALQSPAVISLLHQGSGQIRAALSGDG